MRTAAAALAAMMTFAPTSGVRADDATIVIRTAGHDAYPKFHYVMDGETRRISGLGVDILRAIEHADPAIKFDLAAELIPWARLQRELATGAFDAMIGLVANEKRQRLYDIPDTPLYTLQHVMAVRKPATVDASRFEDFLELGEAGEILTLKGSGTVAYMLKKSPNLRIAARANSIEHGLQLVALRRWNFFYYHDLAIKSAIRDFELGDRITVLPTVFRDYQQYAALTRQLDPQVADRFKRALSIAKASGEIDRIFQSYAVPGS